MIIRREALQAVIGATWADLGRYYYPSIRCEPEQHRVVATNGHVLLIATDRNPQPDDDYPAIPGAPFHGDPSPINLPADAVTKVLKAVPKKPTIPILSSVQLSRNGSDQTATLVGTDLVAPVVATIRADEHQQFPAYDKVMPAFDRPCVSVLMEVDILETIIKAAKAVHGTKTPAQIRFDVPTTHPIVRECLKVSVTGTDVLIEGVAMPCRPIDVKP